MNRNFFILIICFFSLLTVAQAPQKLNSVEIYEQVQKLNFFGKVLYVAAHPDDENTKLITYFSNHYHAQTAYLSLTRGDGGQNLIGTELREKLGAIRTQELLAARRIDGGEQFFTRANDFGFSKDPNETFSIWDKKEVMQDVIQVIETFRPDIIVNRFAHNTPGTTHGHHTASAMLSLETYDVVKHQPKRVFFNTSWWFYGSQEAFDAADKSKLVAINSNVFYPLKGKSNNEIAALSRSQHRSQGFGTLGTRGEETEYLELLKGDLPSNTNLFEGIDTSWNRVKGGNAIGKIMTKIEQHFNFQNPSVHLADLLKAYQLIQNLEDEHWKKIKSEQIKQLIEQCAGLFLEVSTNTETATKDSEINVTIEAINRGNVKIELNDIIFYTNDYFLYEEELKLNKKFNTTEKIKINDVKNPYSNPFWLNEKFTSGMYKIWNQEMRNLPEEQRFSVTFRLKFNDEKELFYSTKKLIYKTNKPDLGEVYIPFRIVPKFTVELPEKTVIFKKGATKDFKINVTAHQDNAVLSEINKTNASKTWYWNTQFEKIASTTFKKGETKTFSLKVTAPEKEETLSFSPNLISDQENKFGFTDGYSKELIEINYPHIPKQTLLLPAKVKFICLDIETKGKNIGYLEGAGDEVGKALENLGYKVTYLKSTDLVLENLMQFDAIMLGIRAFNVVDELQTKNKILFQYVENGGNLIVQYNTTNNLVTKEIAPYNLELSRDRVTDENAKVSFLAPNHPVLNYPNTITDKDFTGWVQEQGLYYPNKWSSEFTPILASNDEGETSKTGGLVIAKHGKGNYIYTGLSFFRELPEGVSGAYRLLANIIALE